MSSGIGSSRFCFPSPEILTSYLQKHPSSKNLNFGNKCPTEKLIQATVNLFATKSISEMSIATGKIEEHITNLFLQYCDYPEMISVKVNLATALKDNLKGKTIEELEKKVAAAVELKAVFEQKGVFNDRKRKTRSYLLPPN